ncbi:SH3 domain-containing protein [Rhodocollybia butyracea]|uniref:SH3 domain-containing protein n=1 Tax=Rhodocollybia butyracea TaxID=206335 RepID=A0A9P5PQ48_9AGAR|nr:SH3 domain-containing protein [Rhodocollybia butyracea]
MANSSDALLAHVVATTTQNIEFLVSQNYLTRTDAASFLSKLENVGSGAPTPFARKAPLVTMSPPSAMMAKAIWPYNEDGADPADLSFGAGDMIEIVEETNADWWTGRFNGRQALFPASYVEKVETSAMPTPMPTSAPAAGRTLPPSFNGAKEKPYKPFGAAYHGVNTPPPPGAGANSVGLQDDAAGQEKKKSKYGKYGNTMAHSAAGGVGFGAG